MKKIALLICSFCLVSYTLRSQSLDECCQMARDHYPAIQKYGLIEKTKEYTLSNAERSWIPQLSFSAQTTWQTEAATFPSELSSMLSSSGVHITGLDKDQYRLALDLHQKIWDGGVAVAHKRQAEAEADIESRQVDVELYRLEERVEDLYFGILLLDERVKQLTATKALLKENLKRVEALLRNGVALQSDVDQIEVEVLTANQNLEQVEATRASYRQMLQVFIGRALSETELTRPTYAEPLSRQSARYELDLFDARSRKLEAQRRLVQSQVMPKFSAFAQGFYGYPGLDLFENMKSDKLGFNAIVGVRMSWNMAAFTTFKNKKRLIETAIQWLDVQKDIFNFNTHMESVQEDGTLLRLQKTLQDDARIVDLRRNVRLAAESQLSHGVIDVTDLLKKITDETSASLNLSVHEIEFLQAQYKLKRILNQ